MKCKIFKYSYQSSSVMPIRMRAKQFAMFDALKGLSEAIAAKEQQVCHKRDLTDNRIDEINR